MNTRVSLLQWGLARVENQDPPVWDTWLLICLWGSGRPVFCQLNELPNALRMGLKPIFLQQ